MHSYYRKQVWGLAISETISILLFIAGIIILAVGTKEECNSYCVETSCRGIDYRTYPCDCGSTCQTKTVINDGVYRLGVAFLIIGIVASIIGSILLCVYRRRYYYYNQPPAVIGGGTVVIQQVPQVPLQYYQPQAGQPVYGYPVQAGYQPQVGGMQYPGTYVQGITQVPSDQQQPQQPQQYVG